MRTQRNSTEEPFWMVVGPDDPPYVRHLSLESAEQESRMLAETNPGKSFYVLLAISVFCSVAVETRPLTYSALRSIL